MDHRPHGEEPLRGGQVSLDVAAEMCARVAQRRVQTRGCKEELDHIQGLQHDVRRATGFFRRHACGDYESAAERCWALICLFGDLSAYFGFDGGEVNEQRVAGNVTRDYSGTR